MHTLEEFKALAPAESISDESLPSEHQLMLNRLAFELAERQRSVFTSVDLLISRLFLPLDSKSSVKV
jgi:THO complex subunit 5